MSKITTTLLTGQQYTQEYAAEVKSSVNALYDEKLDVNGLKTINSTNLAGSGNIALQTPLVSGTNIKSINGNSLLGSGDLVVSASVDYIELRASLFQNGTNPPAQNNIFVDTITPTSRTINLTRSAIGTYKLNILSQSGNPIDPDKVELSFSDGRARFDFASNSEGGGVITDSFQFLTYSPTGTLADLASGLNIYIKIYN